MEELLKNRREVGLKLCRQIRQLILKLKKISILRAIR